MQLGDKLIFKATDKASGTEPWVTDGTTAGTGLLKDIFPGTASSTLSGFTVLGDKLIFQARFSGKSRPNFGRQTAPPQAPCCSATNNPT